MAKQITGIIKLQIAGGQATPAPPVGPALGQHGVNIGDFVKQFNDRTRDAGGTTIPVIINVYADRSFDFITKKPPAAVLIKKALNLASGAADPLRQKVGTLTQDQLRAIAEDKIEDMNASTVETAMRSIAGTARSMGVAVEN